MVTLINALEQRGKKRGVASLCIGGGERDRDRAEPRWIRLPPFCGNPPDGLRLWGEKHEETSDTARREAMAAS